MKSPSHNTSYGKTRKYRWCEWCHVSGNDYGWGYHRIRLGLGGDRCPSLILYRVSQKTQQYFFSTLDPFLVIWTCSKVVKKGPKGSKMVNPSVFDLLTILGPFGSMWTLWTISNKNWFFQPKHLRQTLLFPFGAKSSFFVWNGPKGSRWAQRAPKWSKTTNNNG